MSKWQRVTAVHQGLSFSRRSMFVGGAQAAFGALLTGRMAYLAIAQNAKYELMSESNRVQLIPVPPRRGWIIDRNGKPIAINRSSFRVDLIPQQIVDRARVVDGLTKLLRLQPDDVERINAELDAARGFQPVSVADNIPYEDYAAITVHLPELQGVAASRGFARFYPGGSTVGQLVGYVGAANVKEYERENKNPLLIIPGVKIGKEGLEKTMEMTLRGQPGGQRVEVTARGKLVKELDPKPDRSGGSVKLTIDVDLHQYAARRIGDQSGSVVVLDVASGDILAMPSMPSFDPNNFSDGISGNEWKMLSQNDHLPLVDKVTESLYPSGSTIKPLMSLALLQAGINPSENVHCSGAYRVGNAIFHCDKVHGSVDMANAIMKSCDIYFYQMARRAGVEVIAPMARRLGFGEEFNLPFASQRYGTVPDPEWLMRRYKRKWEIYDTVNMSIGQGNVLVNPLQLAVMAGRIASGQVIQPRLIAGQPMAPHPPLNVTAEHLEFVRRAMGGVVNSGVGTAGAAKLQLPNVQMAGKTGTAQVRRISMAERNSGGVRSNESLNWKMRDHSLFVAFAPVENPRYCAAAVIEHGGFGAAVAAPLVRDTMTFLFDKPKAMAALDTFEQSIGGPLDQRIAAKTAAWRQANGLPPIVPKAMIGSTIIPKPLAKLPWSLILMVSGIAGFGLVVLYSAAGGAMNPWATKQALVFLFFLALAIAMSWLKESTIKSVTFPIFAVIVVMLFGVEVLGLVKKGAQRWLELGPIRLQPSEFMKPAIVLTLARFYELLPASEIRKPRAIWPALALLGVPAFLILVQPDLGTCIMVVLCGITVMFLAGLPLYLFVGSGLALAAAAPIAFSMMHDYQRKRVLIFLDPESDPLGAGYHISQSKIAIGSGGLWGKGFLQGSQSHLDYLPEGHTDFVFATMAEEWGLVGGVLLILAFGMVIRWGMRVSANAKSRFAQLTAAGLSMTIFFYVTINLMMVMGLAPVVGVPLPLVSFGGSAVMTIMICLGILMALERQQRTQSRLE